MNPTREEALFQLALTKPAAERAALLDRECDGDAALRQRLEALLAAHEQPDDAAAPRRPKPPGPRSSSISPTRPTKPWARRSAATSCSSKIGEGGCGVVYVAEQSEPVRRRVALKVIKLGMDTEQVVARFEAERQALAMMDHPNIAKVLDAGATETGRPYFVMELVRGITHHRVLRPEPISPPGSGSSCSSRSARPSSTRIRRGSSTATSSPRTSSSRCTTACRCRR